MNNVREDSGFPTTSDFLAMASSPSSGSGGTGSRRSFDSFTSNDLGDSSSDDGDQLHTPVTGTVQLVDIAYPPILCDTFEGDGSADSCVTASSTHFHPGCFTSPQKLNNAPFKDFISARSPSPVSLMSPTALASPPLDAAMLCTDALLDTQLSLEDTSLDLYPSGVVPSLEPLSSVHRLNNPPLVISAAPRTAAAFQVDQLSLTLSPRKRALSTLSPSNSVRAGQKPKIACAFASEFLPPLLGRSYCARFPPDHHLCADFVREYALEAELGSGGYGFVMTALHRHDGSEVAVKFITKDKIPRYGWGVDEHGKDVPKEALFLSMLHHPGIVNYCDLFEDEFYFYLVQELHGTPWYKRKNRLTHAIQSSPESREDPPVEKNILPSANQQNGNMSALTDDSLSAQDGEPQSSKPPKPDKGPLPRPVFARRASHDLFECIEQSKHKRFSEVDAKYIFAQVVDVVDYLDHLGITHCDIKDENVVIDKDLKIKVIDFGSLVSADPTQPRPFYRRFFGTAAYASPEILSDRPYQAPPAEIWALGVLLAFLVMGTSPFPTEVDKRHGRIVLDEVSTQRMSKECGHLLQRCLEVDPERRANITEVKSHLWLADAFERERKRD